MFLPNGKTMWKDLSLFFVDVDKLLIYIKNYALTGYMHFDFTNLTGIILLQEGDTISGLMEEKGKAKFGKEPIT